MKVSVVIPTWKRAPWLERCLTALEAQTRRPDEVIVVGRAEDRAAQEVVARHNRLPVRWVEVDRPGHVAPVKRGLDEAEGEIVAFLDDDAVPEGTWLEALVEPFQDPKVACVGGQYTYENLSGYRHASARRKPAEIKWYGRFEGEFSELDCPVRTDAVLEGTSAWRRDVISRLDWPEVFNLGDGIYYGLDLCLQARHLGYEVVYTSRARALHHAAPRAERLPARQGRDRARESGRNLTYVALARLTGVMRLTFLLGFWLVGQGQSPGLAVFLRDLLTGRKDAWGRFSAAVLGRVEGFRAWWEAQRSAVRCRASG